MLPRVISPVWDWACTCQGIMQAHDGSIAVSSREGQGTTVVLSLPGTPSEQCEERLGAVDAYLIKPFDLIDLIAALKHVFSR